MKLCANIYTYALTPHYVAFGLVQQLVAGWGASWQSWGSWAPDTGKSFGSWATGYQGYQEAIQPHLCPQWDEEEEIEGGGGEGQVRRGEEGRRTVDGQWQQTENLLAKTANAYYGPG